MPRGRGGRGKKKPSKKKGLNGKRELLFKESGEEYAQVLKLLGGSRMDVMCMDNKRRIAKVRGKFKRRVWVNPGDIILVVLREFEDTKCDIIHVYFSDEAKSLKALGEIPNDIQISEQQKTENNELNIAFEDDEADKNMKKKTEKQDLDNYLPSDSSDDDSDEEPQPKQKEAPKNPAQPSSMLNKNNAPAKDQKKQAFIKKESSEEESEGESDESKSEKDDLADI